MVQELAGEVIDFDLNGIDGMPNLDGLDKFIEENEGSESDALKALWIQYRIEMEWKDYATAAHKNILKLAMTYQKVCELIRNNTGTLSQRGYKDIEGKSLELHEKFQELITLGNKVKHAAIEEKTTNRLIKAIRYLPEDQIELVLSCGHSEFTTKQVMGEKQFKRGDTMTCPLCVEMMAKLMREC